ncbi:hypothetical protein UY3_03417 [Chelonia mydas]|uniref:Uncharacterized protein n=1 Tax=Chelonia mydas TaxID=8469 RepID=M7BU97_CHEMY|nr:hypothetical protein UY3_03417 [Chelonia mydas]
MSQEIVKKLVALGIHQTHTQRRKWLKTDYRKARDENRTSGNLPSYSLFYEGYDQVLGTAPSTEPPELHNSLVSQDGDLLTPESSIGPDDATKMTLLLKPVPKEALMLEQLQHILGLYSEELFDVSPEKQPAMELTTETEEAEVAPEPGRFLAPCVSLLI